MKNIEQRGLPCAFVTTTLFHRIQNGGFRVNGMSNIRRVVYDHSLMAMAERYTNYSIGQPSNTAIDFMLEQGHLTTTDYIDIELMEYAGVADLTCLEQCEIALTAPLTDTERNPAPMTYYDTMQGVGTDDIVIKARNYTEAQQKFNKIAMMNKGSGYGPDSEIVGTNDGLGFYGNFGDGLPLIPPTRELVDEMLAGSERGKYPHDVIGWMKLMGGAITAEKVAINAVMAGAKPEHFPVILAALELMASGGDYDKMWYHGLSTGSDSTLHIMINGPLGKELGITGSDGYAAGAANEVNNVIGRAIRLCYRNIGHMTLEIDDHQYKGREHDHVMILFREEEEYLPGWDPALWDPENPRGTDMWVPYHVEMGFRPEESTITIWAGNSTGGTLGNGAGGTNFWTGSYLSNFGGVTSGAINFFAFSRNMAQELYDFGGIRTKDQLRNTTAVGLKYTTNPIVAGGDQSPVRVFGGYSFYNRQNHQIQLISGATLTENGRSASVFTNSEYIGTLGEYVDAPLMPPTIKVTNPEGAWVPSAPQNLQVQYSAGTLPGRVNATLTWDAPIDDGNSPIIAYQIAFSHSGTVQFYDVTDAPTGVVELGDPNNQTYVSSSYSVYNHANVDGTIVKTSGADRIYNIMEGTSAFSNRTFTLQNIPSGYEVFLRVRAINGLLTALEVDSNEVITRFVGGAREWVSWKDGMNARYSGRGAWMLYDNGRSNIVPKIATAIRIDGAALVTLRRNNTLQLGVTVTPADATPEIIWSSSNPAFASVDENGLVTAISTGTVVITAKTADGALSSTVTIRVIA